MSDFLFSGSLSDIDPEVFKLIQIESERQYRKLIMIPSESASPLAVREALGSSFQNIYAEGYPDEEMRWMSQAEILDYPLRLGHYRRYADPRYYKGTEYCDIIESLARRRCAEAFATGRVSADQLFVNVQALSGAPANNAVYGALVNPGDPIMGMNLLHGGHLTHGSSVNRSGKLYKVVPYNVEPLTERIDYDAVAALALEHKPKMIIAGYSSYPWAPDWARFRQIADSVGAYLLADVSHIAGLIVAGAIPSPVGYAHVITFTTHKTLYGPRGACILTQDSALARKIDRSVFPGEQGGPHMHAIAAMATTFKLAKTEAFANAQRQTIANAQTLTQQLVDRGIRIPYGGTDTHLGNIDCKTIVGPDGTRLSGDMAARILDIAGIVLNRNTIPGDKTALAASGLRFGTPWITQRGLVEEHMIAIADVIADVLFTTRPYSVESRRGPVVRAKIEFEVLESARTRIHELAQSAAIDFAPGNAGYPHFYYLNDQPAAQNNWVSYQLKGTHLHHFLNYVFTSDVEALSAGQSQNTRLVTTCGSVNGILTCLSEHEYQLSVPTAQASLAAAWLRDLSDGYIAFDDDLPRRIPGPVAVAETTAEPVKAASGDVLASAKPYYIGIDEGHGEPLPAFAWAEKEPETLQRTPLFDTHRAMGARMIPFAGWEMPVWYSSVLEEHVATRQAAGLFDVSHMGVYQAEGRDAAAFLDSVCANDIAGLAIGESCYTHFLDPDANVIDDTLVYRRDQDRYLVVVNASNDEKDWAWFTAVKDGKVKVDNERPWVRAFGRQVILRNLRDRSSGADMRVDIALQGPKSREILLSLGVDGATRRCIMGLKWTELCEAQIGGFDLIISRTGYTGERMAFELFVHPDRAVDLWQALLKAGEPSGLKACGLGARDSLRTEAGLPLYGHEMGGALNLGVAEAGFASYVKVYKPWFIGRSAFIKREQTRKVVVARFRFAEKGVRTAHLGDPVLDPKGRVIGTVTSCAIDKDGYLTGQAVVDIKHALEGTPVLIFQSAPKSVGKVPAELSHGDRFTLPSSATIASRFPKLA